MGVPLQRQEPESFTAEDEVQLLRLLRKGVRARNQGKLRSLVAEERRWRAYEMSLEGFTTRQIQVRLGYKHQRDCWGAIRSVAREVQSTHLAAIEERRDSIIQALNHQLRNAAPLAATGDVPSIAVAIKILDMVADLEGVKAPVKAQLELISNLAQLRQEIPEGDLIEVPAQLSAPNGESH